MSKELTPLEALDYIKKNFLSYEIPQDSPNCVEELFIIETALKEKKQYDDIIAYGGGIYAANGIIGKQLKAFEIIKKMYEYFVKKYRDLEPKLMICEKEDFDNVEKSLKALELIKNKEVDVSWFKYCLKYCENDTSALKRYNKNCDIEITVEEYELLKEVLNEE